MSNDIAQTNAREKALIEEEKWLIENLKKIRAQRNALKVEALYFQGLKAELFQMHAAQFAGKSNAGGDSYFRNAGGNCYYQNTGDNSYSQDAGHNSYSQNAGENTCSQNTSKNYFTPDEEESEPIPEPVGDTNLSNIDDFNIVEERCNEIENLNLNIIPDHKPIMDMEPEYDSEDEEGEWDKIPLEMGLLVSGHCNQFQADSNE